MNEDEYIGRLVGYVVSDGLHLLVDWHSPGLDASWRRTTAIFGTRHVAAWLEVNESGDPYFAIGSSYPDEYLISIPLNATVCADFRNAWGAAEMYLASITTVEALDMTGRSDADACEAWQDVLDAMDVAEVDAWRSDASLCRPSYFGVSQVS